MIKVEKITANIMTPVLNEQLYKLTHVIWVSGSEAESLYKMLKNRANYRGTFVYLHDYYPYFHKSRMYAFCLWNNGKQTIIQTIKAEDFDSYRRYWALFSLREI